MPHRRTLRIPSPAAILAVGVLVVAVSGIAQALPGSNTVFSDDITNGNVKILDLAPSLRPVYARVKASGAIDATRSRGIPSGSVTQGTVAGIYCFDLPFKPKSVQATPSTTTALNALASVVPSEYAGGCTSTKEAEVVIFPEGATSTPTPDPFYVSFVR
jgi:hypothetical protein